MVGREKEKKKEKVNRGCVREKEKTKMREK